MRLNTRLPIFACLILGLPLISGAVQPPTGTPPKPAKQPSPSAVQLAEEVYHVDEVGLSMRLPADTMVEATRIGDRVTRQVAPSDATWIMNIQTPKTKNPEATIQQAMDDTVALIQGSVGVMDPDQKVVLETQAKIIDRVSNLKINGTAAERVYISVPRENSDRLVKGYTIFKASPTQFVVFELLVAESQFQKARPLYETSVGTAVFEGSEGESAARAAAIKSGAAFLATVTPDDYAAASGDGKELWQRLYRPAPSGSPADAEELGYRGVKFWKGKRGEIDPSRPKSTWSKTDQEDGWLVQVRGRLVIDKARVADTIGIYFMTPDRSEEAWSVRTAVRRRDGKPDPNAKDREKAQEITAMETGARTGKELEILVKESGMAAERIKPFFQEEGYLSQFETFLLHRLLVAKRIQTEVGFYAYQSRTRKVSMRRDDVSREPGTRGAWEIKTSYFDDTASQSSLYNERGELISAELGDGRVWEPVNPELLMHLWQQKGLPVDR